MIPVDDTPIPLATKAGLVIEVIATYVRARLMINRRGLKATLAALRDEPLSTVHGPRPTSPLPTGRRLGRVVTRTLAPLPADTRCLMRSLVLTRVLARRGIDSRLVIGVQPGQKFAAHAWLEHDGAPLLPAGGGDFDELVTL